MIVSKNLRWASALFLSTFSCFAQNGVNPADTIPYKIYPEVIETRPDLPSPLKTKNGNVYVTAVNKENKFAIIEVTRSNENEICPQLIVNHTDFPYLAKTGLHDEKRLDKISTITGRSLEEITRLGRPNGLSQAGFMADDENIIAVIKGDNQIVRNLGLTHPQLAAPLFHVLNMMAADLALDRWNMAKHRWENIQYFYYNGHKVFVEAEDTKGGQKSIFEDNIEGSFYIKLWRNLEAGEIDYLKKHYNFLSQKDFDNFTTKLSLMNTGEIQPQYIMRYGFYEGHTFWRTDPIAIAFIFGLKSLAEIDSIYAGQLHQILFDHHTD